MNAIKNKNKGLWIQLSPFSAFWSQTWWHCSLAEFSVVWNPYRSVDELNSSERSRGKQLGHVAHTTFFLMFLLPPITTESSHEGGVAHADIYILLPQRAVWLDDIRSGVAVRDAGLCSEKVTKAFACRDELKIGLGLGKQGFEKKSVCLPW